MAAPSSVLVDRMIVVGGDSAVKVEAVVGEMKNRDAYGGDDVVGSKMSVERLYRFCAFRSGHSQRRRTRDHRAGPWWRIMAGLGGVFCIDVHNRD